jgi:hypothetical protein
MKKKFIRPNFDYEFKLFSIPSFSPMIDLGLETLPLFLENETEKLLISGHFPSEEFLNYAKKINPSGASAKRDEGEAAENWWGALNDIDLEQRLNSKLTSVEIALENKWAHSETCLVSRPEDIDEAIARSRYGRWVLKDPYMFSGMGSELFDRTRWSEGPIREAMLLRLMEYPQIFEPWLSRTGDFGVTVAPDNSMHIVQNFTDPRGRFRGGVTWDQEGGPTKYRDTFLSIANSYRDMGATRDIQIDCFSYTEGVEEKFYPLVEVNYRRTMGQVVTGMQQKFAPQNGVGGWFLIRRKERKEVENFNKLLELCQDELWSSKEKTGVIFTSDTFARFTGIFVAEIDRETLKKRLARVWKLLSKSVNSADPFHASMHI